MTKRPALTFEEATKLFRYMPDTGHVISKVKTAFRPIGARVGESYNMDEPSTVSVKGRMYRLHRLVWLLNKGEWPEHMLKFKDGDHTNHRIENLEHVSPHNNINLNRIRGIIGVAKVTKTKKWKAVLHYQGRQCFLGEYVDMEEAIYARLTAEDWLGLDVSHRKSARYWIRSQREKTIG